jgi:hypothetical protein
MKYEDFSSGISLGDFFCAFKGHFIGPILNSIGIMIKIIAITMNYEYDLVPRRLGNFRPRENLTGDRRNNAASDQCQR